jgi:hypothetical protein
MFGSTRCAGPGSCTDPVSCCQAFLSSTSGKFNFKAAWRQREAEIELLASRADEKLMLARRIPVVWDTTTLKSWMTENSRQDGAQEPMSPPIFPVSYIVWKLVSQHPSSTPSCTQRLVYKIKQMLSLTQTGYHSEQLHLAEYVAHRSREIIMNLNLTTDAKNIVVVKAKDFLTSAVTVEDFEDAEQEKPEFVQVEDVGGFAAESDMEEDVGEVTKELTKCVLPHSDDPEVILKSLFRSKDVADARACLSHKAMKDQSKFALEVEQVFGKLVRLKY